MFDMTIEDDRAGSMVEKMKDDFLLIELQVHGDSLLELCAVGSPATGCGTSGMLYFSFSSFNNSWSFFSMLYL